MITHANIVVTYVNTLFTCVIKNEKMKKFNYIMCIVYDLNIIKYNWKIFNFYRLASNIWFKNNKC